VKARRRKDGLTLLSLDGALAIEESAPEARPQPRLALVGQASIGTDPARMRRVKALATTAPLHDLESNKRLRPGWEPFDLYDLALATIDAVVDRMGFDSGIPRAALDEQIAAEAARFAPTASPALHAEVAGHVIATLTDARQQGYEDAEDGQRRLFDFRLLDEVEGIDGIYLRATKEAINVLVGALDTDLESAHAAAEARLANLIKRGRLPDAAGAAREARLRSVQFMLEVQRFIADTRRDIRQVDWAEAVPARLSEMLTHLDERTAEETKMLAAMREARDEAQNETLGRQAAELVATVEDCFARHTELHNQIQQAEGAFFEEQARQVFAPPVSLRAIDLTDELLIPALGLAIENAEPFLTRFVERLWGPRVPIIARWSSAVAYLLQPPQERELGGEEVAAPEWDDAVVDARLFSDETWAAVSKVLDLDPDAAPVRLSALIDDARATGDESAEILVRLRVMTAVSPDFAALRHPGAFPALAAGRDGRLLQESSGLWGDDLLVGTIGPTESELSEGESAPLGGHQLFLLAPEEEVGT